MTGWRLGYAAAPALILKQMLKIHQFAIMCAPTTSQYAAVDALRNGDEDIARMKKAYDERRRYLLREFRALGMDCFEPYGAFYMFPCIKRFGMTSMNSQTACYRKRSWRLCRAPRLKLAARLSACFLCVFPGGSAEGHRAHQAVFGTAAWRKNMLNIVLYEPEMPMNTGNIGRSCVATNTRLHLIEPLGFKLNDKMVKRAGLDYWPHLDVTVYSDFKDFLEKNPGARPYMATTKTTQVYTDVHYDPDCYIMFGPESRGIPEELLIEDPERCVRIPMWGEMRSLNLSNSVAIILYEALRQNGFEKMNTEGHLHHLQWK